MSGSTKQCRACGKMILPGDYLVTVTTMGEWSRRIRAYHRAYALTANYCSLLCARADESSHLTRFQRASDAAFRDGGR